MKYILTMVLLLMCSTSTGAGYSIRTYIPNNAKPLLPLVHSEVQRFSPGFDAGFMAGAIEQESCISLRHSKCWSPRSRLKTRREEGAGLGQLTRTYYRNGKIRFDTLTRLARKYRTHLKGLTWNSVYRRGDLQIRAMVLLFMEGWNELPNTITSKDKLAFIVSGYNQGMGGVRRDRRLCGLKSKCNPNKWFGHVGSVKRVGFSTRRLYGNRTAWDINRKHVHNVIVKRMPKYRSWYRKH